MRLICPNCDAQYEVPDEVMPKAGRDVQCSNCGQTWFQHHPDNAAEEDEAEEQAAFDAGFTDRSDELLEEDEPADVVADAAEDVSPEHPFPNLKSEAEAAAAPPPPPTRRPLDPAVAEILRQEAAAEQEARRRRQSEALERQPDLGLDDGASLPPAQERDAEEPAPAQPQDTPPHGDEADRRAQEARLRMARMRGEPAPAETEVAQGSAPRRALLPDIEEINSTLRHDRGQTAGPTPTAALDTPQKERRSGGFMRGFALMLALAAVLSLIYVYAPEIAQTLPQADPYLSSYVAWMDDARLWLDGQVQDLLVWLDTVATQSQG